MNPKSGSLIRAAVLAVLTSSFSTQVSASGFGVTETSASAQGNAYAGAAANAEDASTVWFNPAGMMKLESNQIIVGGHYIKTSSSFVNQGSTHADGSAMLGGNDEDAFAEALVPNFYWVTAINEEMKFGLGITAPFGLVTDYDDTWVGRYHGVLSDLKTVNINPSLAFQLNEKLSVGVGISIMLLDITLTSAVDFGSLLGAPGAADGFADLTGDNLDVSNVGYGFNLGLMYDFTPKTTLGLAYRSEVDQEVEGKAKFKVPTSAAPILSSGAFVDSGLSAAITLPQSFSISVAHEMEKLTLLADVTWTGWSSFDELRIKYDNPAQPDSVTTEDWEDTFRYSIGVDWQQSEKLTLRTGIALDEAAVPSDERRTPRIPGNDRTWLSFGGTYIISPAFTVDIGYTHIFISDTKINNTFESSQPALASTLTGTYEDVAADIFSAQLRWNY
ncbi:MAG: transporter [Gammaproteobacteria bacterium]|nr:MAG: transporter [Gammaproteobacteria bacterium]